MTRLNPLPFPDTQVSLSLPEDRYISSKISQDTKCLHRVRIKVQKPLNFEDKTVERLHEGLIGKNFTRKNLLLFARTLDIHIFYFFYNF